MSVFAAKSTAWANSPSTTTPVNASGLNDLESRIASAFSLVSNSESVVTHGADPSGVADSTTAFNTALAAGSTLIPAGTYFINGVVAVNPAVDLIGVGSGKVTIKLGTGGQIAHGSRTGSTTAVGGTTGGFTVDGQNLANVAGGAFYVGFCLKRKFADLVVINSAGDNIVVETAQNCTWDTINNTNAGRSCFVLDYGAGGHVIYNMEAASPGLYSVEFRQTGQSAGGYPTFLGPSGNQFFGGIAEYGTGTNSLVYHGAGTNNQFYGFSVCPTGRSVVGASGVLMEAAANAISTTATVTSGSSDITVASATGISALMCASVPGFPAGSVVANVVGNVVTMFGTASSNHAAGTAVSFGAQSSALSFDGLVSPGTAGKTYAIETKGNVQVTLTGRTTFTDHIAALKTYGNDAITLDGPASYFDTSTRWIIHPSDDSGVSSPSEDKIVRSQRYAGMDMVTAPDAAARALVIQRSDQSHPNVIVYPGGLRFSDGTVDPVNTGISAYTDTDGLEYLYAFSQLRTSFLKLLGAAGATTSTRYFGLRAAAGPPATGTWTAGDQIIDSGGSVWLCTASGTPGTWSSGSRPSYIAPTFVTNVANYTLGDPCGSSLGGDHRVLLRGALVTSAAFAANATLATITAAHRPSSAIVLGTGVQYTSGGSLLSVPVSVDSSGNVQAKVALGSGDALFLDGFTYHAA